MAKIDDVNRKSEMILIIVSVLVILVLCFMIYTGSKIEAGNSQEVLNETFLNGTLFGVQATVLEILNTATKCEAVEIPYEDEVYQLVWTECLQNG